jgi:hypothetical protein
MRLLGDMEFLVIFRSPFDWADIRRRMSELSRQATEALGAGGHVACIEYAPAGISYLRRSIRPSIFAYDLLRHGKVVWGRPDILGEAPRFGADAIPREDAIELIMNRMMELLIDETSVDHEARAYQLAKTMLDMAGSVLASVGQYISPYAERQKPFEQLLAAHPDLGSAAFDPEGFQRELELATHTKLAPTPELLFREEMAHRVAEVQRWVRDVWIWEVRRFLGAPTAQFPELVHRYMRHEPLSLRLRRWVKYYRHPLRPHGAVVLRRMLRLLPLASPRALAYAAALLAYEGKAQGVSEWESAAASLLPVPLPRENGAALREAAELWRWLIRNN